MKSVLVVEDNEVNRELIKEILGTAGFDVSEAVDGIDALEQLAARRPDVVLLDLQMPRLDGRETLKRIRANPELSGLPVIVCTASAMQGDKEDLLRCGFDGYISKPVAISELIKTLHAF